jgi:short-subunit dehydrogenase
MNRGRQTDSSARVALITGASSGLGRELARQLAGDGWRVGLVARRAEQLAEVCAEIVQSGGEAHYGVADVRDWRQTQAAIELLTSRLGCAQWVIANAGVAPPESVRAISVEDLRRMIEVNYLGVVHTFSAVLPAMLDRGSGRLAAVSSLAAFRGLPSMCGYAASKAAVNAFLQGLRVELRGTGIEVTTICPGYIATPMTARNVGAMPFLLQADDAARRIVRALERGRREVAFPWPLALAAKLNRHAPDWLVHLLSPREVVDAPPTDERG